MMKTIFIDGNSLTLNDIVKVARENFQAGLTGAAITEIKKSREYVEKLVKEERVVYGVTTGFGKFADVSISKDETETLQKNLIVSHACGVGKPLPEETVRAMMLLRANALSKGYSGVCLETIQALLDMLNKEVHPVIPEKGSLGASGDLAPLSHMVLPLIGLGEAYYKGRILPGAEAMKQAGIKILVLSSKEGLALINGTQALTSIGALALYDALRLLKLCDISASLTVEALNGITDAYLPCIHELRPHRGQVDTAENLLKILKGSQRVTGQGEVRLQDAYSLRCIPQIHGASKDAVKYIRDMVAVEINSVTDNPLIFPEMDIAVSGGNFHGQPMALPFDFLGIALAELADACERRIERLVNPQLSGLPAFLTEHGGLHSGFMIAQYTAAALVSENKVLAHPASVDSIPTSANQEDHVSMGTIAARKAREIYFNTSNVIAIELLAAAQAIDLNPKDHGKKLGKGTAAAYEEIRKAVRKLGEDRELYLDFNKIAELIESNVIVEAVEKAIGQLK